MYNIAAHLSTKRLIQIEIRLMGVNQKCRLRFPKPVPGRSEFNLLVTDAGLSCLPTHALVIHPPSTPSTALPPAEPSWMNLPYTRDMRIKPIHAAILAAHCGRLPEHWPESRPRPPPGQVVLKSGEIVNGYRIPVVPLCLPCPEAFDPLARYMYDHQKDHLLNALVRIKVTLKGAHEYPPIYFENPALREGLDYKKRLYRVVTDCMGFHIGQLSKIHEQMQFVEGFWKNAVALAVSDDDMWEILQLAWEGLVLAVKWLRDAHAQIAEHDAQEAAAAAQKGLQVAEQDPKERLARNKRLVEQYVTTQLKDGQGKCF